MIGHILMNIAEIAIAFEISNLSYSSLEFNVFLQMNISLTIKKNAKINNENPIIPFDTKIWIYVL